MPVIVSFPSRALGVVLLAAFSAGAADVDAQERQPPALTEFADLKDIRSALVSPDGHRIADVVATIDLKANRVLTELSTYGYSEGKPRRYTLPTDAIEKVLWSPQSDRLAVMGKPRDQSGTGLWVVDQDSGESRLLLKLDRSNHYLAHQGANLCWSPDGKSLAYLAADPKPAESVPGPLVVTRQQYKTRTAFSDNRPTHIWIVDVATGKTRQLTTGRFDEHSIDWSPKGDEIVFCSNRANDPDANLNYDLYTAKVSDGTIRPLTKTAGNEMAPVWSPDGRSVAYLMTKRAATTIDSVAEDDHVWVVDRETGKARELTDEYDRRCGHVRWSPNGKSVYFLARSRGRGLLCQVPAEGGDVALVLCLNGMVSSFSLSSKPGPAVCVLSTPTQPAEVHTFNSEGGRPRARTGLNSGLANRWNPVAPKEISFKSFDGTSVHGWLLLPPGAKAEHSVPLLLYIHGGPHGMWTWAFYPTFQLLCARGYGILYLNPRGSNGYGQKFSDGCVNDWGGGDYKDLMAGVDYALAKNPQLDPARMGVTGGSYGGYMTNWVITQTDRFNAAVTYASLSNLISFYATSLYQDLVHVEFHGEPWDHYDLLWERSPLKHIKRVKTPTLILHGEADNDVHITQSEELFTALKRRGVETVFVRYPREGHGASEPAFQLDQLEQTAAWFDKYLRQK